MAEELVNLGGVNQGNPIYQPVNPSTFTNVNSTHLSSKQMLEGIKTGNDGRVESLGGKQIYTGNRYNSSFPYMDVEESAAQQQSGWDQLANGFGKMIGTAGSTFLNGTVGTLTGIGSMIINQRFASFYDNPVNRQLDEFNKSMEDYLPNYYTNSEKDASWYSTKNILTANFWSDKVLKNLGFSIGAIGAGVAWGGVFSNIGLTNRLVQAGKGLETVEAVETAILNAPKAGKFGAISQTLNSLSNAYLKPIGASVLKNADRTLISVMGSMGEAGIESLQNMNEVRSSMINDYINKYGVAPNEDEISKINQYAEKVGNFTWGMNVALLSATNYIQLPKILGSSMTAEKRAMNSVVKEDLKKGATITEQVSNKFTKSKLSGVGNVVKSYGGAIIPEAFEEGSQFAIQIGVNSYFSRAYDTNKDVTDFFSNLSGAFGEVLGEGVHKALNTKEGLESILIGGLSGGIQSSISPFGNNIVKEIGFTGTGGSKGKNTDTAVDQLNKSNLFKVLQDGVKYASIAINSQKLRNQAIQNNDTASEKDYEKDYALAYVIPRVKYGKADSIENELELYKTQASTEEGFQELKSTGVIAENETREKFLTRLSEIQKTADQVSKTYDLVNDKYSNLIDEKGERAYPDEVIDKLVYASAKIVDYDSRIPGVITKLALDGVNIVDPLISLTQGDNTFYNAIKEGIEKDTILTSDEKEQRLQNLKDVKDLALRRQEFLKQYEEIKKAPVTFKDPKITPTKVDEEGNIIKDTITIKGNTGEKELEVGEEYYLGKVVEWDKSGKKVISFPKLTILGQNEDGTIKIKDSNGTIKDISKKELESYKITKVKGKFSRLDILNELFNEVSNNHTRLKALISQKSEQLNNTKDKLSNLTEQIKNAEVDKQYKKAITFKSNTRKALASAMELSRMKEQLENEIKSLESESEELEINASYIADLSENIDQLPNDSEEFLEELKDQRSTLEDLILDNGIQINNLSKLITNVEKALKSAIDFALDNLSQFKKKYGNAPVVLGQEYVQFLKETPLFLRDAPNYKQDLKQLDEIIAQVEDLDIIPNERSIKELKDELSNVQDSLKELEKEVKAKDLIISKFEEIIEKYNNKKEEEKLLKDNQKIQEEILETADLGIQTREYNPNYEINKKKDNLTVISSTKVPNTSVIPHIVRANNFGFNWGKFKNKDNIRGVIVTSKNEELLGLKGLTKHLIEKGDSTIEEKEAINPANTIALVMVLTNDNNEIIGLVGENGEVLINPSLENSIYQVFPETLTWSKQYGGDSMFRKGTSKESIDTYTLEYNKWRNEQLENTELFPQEIKPSFGIPTITSRLDSQGNKEKVFNQRNSVLETGLIEEKDLVKGAVIFVPTTNDTITTDSGSSFDNALGRPFLSVNGNYVKLNNRKITKKESEVIFKVIKRISSIMVEEGTIKDNEEAAKLVWWLKSVIYWGTPKNETGYNSVFFRKNEENFLELVLSGKEQAIFDFTPSSLEDNKSAITAILSNMYNNVNSTLVSADNKNEYWKQPYIEILDINDKSEVETKKWKNYQTYLLNPAGRKPEELPLATPIEKVTEEKPVNREGIYFTIPIVQDRYANLAPQKLTPLPTKTQPKEEVKGQPQPQVKGGYVFDGKTVNVYVGKNGKTLNFQATQEAIDNNDPLGITLVIGGDRTEIYEAELDRLAKEESVLGSNMQGLEGFLQENNEPLTKEQKVQKYQKQAIDNIKKGIIARVKSASKAEVKETVIPKKQPQAPAIIKVENAEGTISFTAEELAQMKDDESILPENIGLRKKLKEKIEKFEKEDWKKIEHFLKKNFSGIPVYRVKNTIKAANGVEGWGMFKNGAIYIYENAEKGTAYHEVFEAVWGMFATPQEISNIKKEFRNRQGTFVDRPSGQTINYKDATDYQLKEELAEEFREYIIDRKLPVGKGIIKFFADLISFIKNWVLGKNINLLFNKINDGGYSKSYSPYTQQLKFAQKGFIDIEQAYASGEEDFRIKNIPATQSHEIMQHLTYKTLETLIKDNKGLFKISKNINKDELYKSLKTDLLARALIEKKNAEKLLDDNQITKENADVIIYKSRVLWKSINDGWSDIIEKHSEYLKTYNIEFDENDEVQVKSDEKSSGDPYADPTKLDSFRKANSAIKLMVSMLPIVDSDNQIKLSSVNGVQLLPASQVFISIMNKVHDAKSVDEMVERVKEMGETDLNYSSLYKILLNRKASISEVTDKHTLQLLSSFWSTFKKQNPDVKLVTKLENGEITVQDSNFATAARQLVSEYSSNIVKNIKKGKYYTYNEQQKRYNLISKSLNNTQISTLPNMIAFLKTLDIDFDSRKLLKLQSKDIQLFKLAVSGIHKSMSETTDMKSPNTKILDIKSRLLDLGALQTKINNPQFASTFYNINGEKTQTYIGTNALSNLYDVLSTIDNIQDLVNTPYEYLLTDSFSKTYETKDGKLVFSSVILKSMFDEAGDRISSNTNYLKPGWADGTLDQEKGKSKQSSKLTYRERLVQELSLNLKGWYYNLIPGDSTLEHMVYMGNNVAKSSLAFNDNQIYDIFKGYVFSELSISREKRNIVGKDRKTTDLRFLKNILSEELHNKIVKEKGTIEKVYEDNKDQINKELSQYFSKQTKSLESLLEEYKISDIDKSDLKYLTVNYAINNIELHKLLYSDPYFYKDELKRIKSFLSPRKPIVNSSPEYNKALNRIYNEGVPEIGQTDFLRDYFTTATVSDVIGKIDLPNYENFIETDAMGMITLKAKRWFMLKEGIWTENNEDQYLHDLGYELLVEKNATKEELEKYEENNPSDSSVYIPLKPIVSGAKGSKQTYNDVMLDKFALYPLSFRILHKLNPDSNALKLYKKMQAQDIDYVVFESGRKVGNEKSNDLYEKDGSFKTTPFEALIKVPHNIISVQSEIPSKEEPVVPRATQITKLVTMDFMNSGIPIDYLKDQDVNKVIDQWSKLTEDQKKKESPLYAEIKHNENMLKEMTNVGYQSLLKKLNIIEKNGEFTIPDLQKTGLLLKDEILKREVNDNITASINAFIEGKSTIEATSLYQQIRNILYSIADKAVISPKLKGGQKVQITSTLLESVRAKEKDGAYTSDVLSFYEKDGKRVCEVMIGRWFDSPLSDEELLKYLNTTEEGQKILSGVAYRIPTQKQNSIESFVIKQFLPKEFGDSVVVPAALVEKVGSDFDIDKLYMYFKNTYNDFKGNLKLIPYYGTGEIAKDKFRQMFEEGDLLPEKAKKIITNWIKNRKIEDKEDTVNNLAVAIFGESAYDQEVIDDYLESEDYSELKERIVDKAYKQSIDNEYVQSLQNLISHPLNFDRLIIPNSAKQLKDLSKKIVEKLGFDQFDYSLTGNMLNRHFMSRLRHSFVSGKYAIGIAAVNQTNHSLNQRQPTYIDYTKLDNVSAKDMHWLSGGTMLKQDTAVKFKKFNKVKVGNRMHPSLSGITNSVGDYISDVIGQFIDGYVDISKGPWIMELGANPNVAPTWLFLVKLGVPVEDVAYFMNQPIIEDFLKELENDGYSYIFNSEVEKTVRNNEKYQVSLPNSIKEIPTTSKLFNNIGKKTFNNQEKLEQQFILGEFFKYAKMSEQLFYVIQGSNFDTSNFNDPLLIYKKSKQLEKARQTIISSVDDILKNSFLGELEETLYKVRSAYAGLLISESTKVRAIIEKVLEPYIGLNDDDFIRVGRKVISSVFDYAVQTTNSKDLQQGIKNVLIADNNTVEKVSDFVMAVKNDGSHDLHDNIIIKLIVPHITDREQGVNNLKIKNKENQVYDQNQMIYGFEELKSFLGEDSPIYKGLINVAVLQSGLTNSPISFTSLLPFSDFEKIYNEPLSNLENIPTLGLFNGLKAFQRNNWNNPDIVPKRNAKYSNSGTYNTNMKFAYSLKNVGEAIDNGDLPQLLKLNENSREANYDVVVYTWKKSIDDLIKLNIERGNTSPEDIQGLSFAAKKDLAKDIEMKLKKQGDYSYINRGLFQKVYVGGSPLSNSYTIDTENGSVIITDYIYKNINAWGESYSQNGMYFSANEYYAQANKSVIDNGFIKVNEVSDATINSYFNKFVKKQEGTTKLPECRS